MSAGTDEQQINDDLTTTSTWLLTAFFLGWGALFVRVCMQGFVAHLGPDESRVAAYGSLAFQTATAFVWSLAWLTGGFLFGFIFGIPKVIAATTSGTNPALNAPPNVDSPKLKVNTNLEDISDWLTKILVGATLTQIVKIPGAISRAATFMSANDLTLPVSFNAAILVYYSCLGFLSGYILTRMFFARAFALADEGPRLSPEAAKSLDETSVGFGTVAASAGFNPVVRKAALASEAVPISESLSGNQALRLAKGATLTGDAARALTASKIALQKLPDDPQAQLTYAWSLHKLGASLDVILPIVESAAQKLDQDADPSVLSMVYASLAYLWLYQPPPAGYENALRVLADYERKGGQANAEIEIDRACAFGQKYSYLKNAALRTEAENEANRSLDEARNNAIEAVRKALSLDPGTAIRLKELLWVSADPEDNDLSAFQNDPEFTNLLPRS